jgi:hypothetical protein
VLYRYGRGVPARVVQVSKLPLTQCVGGNFGDWNASIEKGSENNQMNKLSAIIAAVLSKMPAILSED